MTSTLCNPCQIRYNKNDTQSSGGSLQLSIYTTSGESLSSMSAASIGEYMARRKMPYRHFNDYYHRSDTLPLRYFAGRDESTTGSASETTEDCCCIHGQPCVLATLTSGSRSISEANSTSSIRVRSVQANEKSETPELPPSVRKSSSKRFEPVFDIPEPSDQKRPDSGYENAQFGAGEVVSARKISSRSNSITALSISADETSPLLLEYYIGALRRRDAETRHRRRGEFRLYHRIPSGTSTDLSRVKPAIALHFVYRNSKGRYLHLPIIATEYEVRNDPGNVVEYYFLEIDDDASPRFKSIEGLLRYYILFTKSGQPPFGETARS